MSVFSQRGGQSDGARGRYPRARIIRPDYKPSRIRTVNRIRQDQAATRAFTNRLQVSSLCPWKTSCFHSSVRDRPFMGQSCSRCTTDSREFNYETPPLSSLGLHDELIAAKANSDGNIFSRTFYYASFVLSRKPAEYKDVGNRIIKCPRVAKAVQESAQDEFEELREDQAGDVGPSDLRELLGKHQRRARDVLERMKTCISSSLLRIAGWVLYKLLSRLLNQIVFHKGQIERLKKVDNPAAKTPVIYLPLHRSHLDYILVSFILYMNNIRPPLVAAGDNLNIPFFGNLMRGLGAFFIKRRLDPENGKKDRVYRAILHSYMAENLREGHAMEFFIEGGRSRTGKALLPKAGLLSVVVDSVLEGVIDDCYIVPVAISYEKLIEGSFVNEQLGQAKVSESFGLAARAIWKTLHSNFGSVRVDFCQPFSLRGYLRQLLTPQFGGVLRTIDPKCAVNNTSSLTSNRPPCVACSGLRSVGSVGYGLDMVITDDKRHAIVELAEHVIHDAYKNMALMATNLVTFLLLNKHRKGTSRQTLVQSMNWIRQECSRRNRDVGFSGESIDAVNYVCNLLGQDLIIINKISAKAGENNNQANGNGINNNNKKTVFFIRPNIKVPRVLELQYYANSCLTLFLMESVLANAIYSLVHPEPSSGPNNNKNYLTVGYDALVDKAVELCDILQYDFLFAPPCTPIAELIKRTIDDLMNDELLAEDQKQSSVIPRRPFDFEDPEDDEDDGYFWDAKQFERKVRVFIDNKSAEKWNFFRSVLLPFIESYWLAAESLNKLVGTEKEDRLFQVDMLVTGKEKLQRNQIQREESIAADTMKNALKLFESWKVIESTTSNSAKVLYLTDDYNDSKSISNVIQRIEQFK